VGRPEREPGFHWRKLTIPREGFPQQMAAGAVPDTNVPPERKRRVRMRRVAPFFFASLLVFAFGCETTTDVCYFDGVEVDCGGDVCLDYCEDADGLLQCTDTGFDPYNCGACGAECFDGVCNGGVCEAAGFACEDSGLTTCVDAAGYDYCADTMTDDYNCGDCTIECALGCDGAGSCL
jgi:hypothetical protein